MFQLLFNLLSASALVLAKVKILSSDLLFQLYDTITTLNPFPKKPLFSRVFSTSLLKTMWEKEKLLVTSNFSFSHSLFYPFGDPSRNFIKLSNVCKLFQFGRVYNSSFGKGLMTLENH